MGKRLIIWGADFSANAVKTNLIDELLMGFYDAANLVFYPEGSTTMQGKTTGWMTTNIFRPSGTKVILYSPKNGTIRLRQYDESEAVVSNIIINTNVEVEITPNLRTILNFRTSENNIPYVTNLTVFSEGEIEAMQLLDV